MLAILAPGQGAQKPGFLAPWLELPGVADRLTWWSAVTGLDLVAAGTEWDAERIRDTAVAQPLLVAAGLAVAEQLRASGPDDAIGVVAGHSVGELTAAAITGALSPEAALVFVRARGQAMAAASAAEPTGMAAVLGGDAADVVDRLEHLDLTPANHNGGGQIVAAGRLENLEKLAAEPPAGARVRSLSVAGAFHTRFMAPATEALEALAPGIPVKDPHIRLLSNADGAVVTNGTELLRRLVAQVAAPVRWDQCMRTLADLGVDAVIELAPAGTLTGLIRRELKGRGIETCNLDSPDALGTARDLLAAHGHFTPAPAPSWRVVVAPVGGRFERGADEPGDRIATGGAVGSVEVRGKLQPVVAPHGGTVVEWLAHDGDPVSPGQPLLRLHPESGAA